MLTTTPQPPPGRPPAGTDAEGPRPLFEALRGELLPRRGPSRALGLVAAFWLASAVLHLGVFAVDGGPWSGPVSWRKPIVFALSIGLLGWAIGWLLDRLPDRRPGAWAIAGVYAVSASAEVTLITIQQWRGRASHFNLDTATDATVFTVMGIMVGFMSLAIVAVIGWAIFERPTDPAVRTAALWGFGLIVLGLGVGQWLIQLGSDYYDRFGQVPSTVTYGEDGVAKFPHALAFHGIQLLAVASALATRGRASSPRSQRLVRTAALGYGGLTLFSGIQTLGGRGPLDLSTITLPLLVVSIAVIGWALAALIQEGRTVR